LDEWKVSDRDEGALLRGIPLVIAQGWLEKRENDLNEQERAFIGESLALRQREVRNRLIRYIALGIAAALVVLMTVWSLIRERNAEIRFRKTETAIEAVAEAVRVTSDFLKTAEASARATARAAETMVAAEIGPERRATAQAEARDAEATVQVLATAQAGAPRIREKDGAVMVYVPAGEFWMGSYENDSSARDDEKPRHKVYLDAFWIGRTEVTNAQYKQCVETGLCSVPADDGRYSDPDYASYPVVHVEWLQANRFCAWVGGRLPSEAEWEKAARGTNARLYPWGGNPLICERAQFRGCEPSGSLPVGSKSPAGDSPYDAVDMAGNVWEWVADWYDGDYYEDSPEDNPTGPEHGDYKVLRGGGWSYGPDILRAAYRGVDYPASRSDSVGFRCVGAPGQ